MLRYIPPFILDRYAAHSYHDVLSAYVLLIDIADFTAIGTSLQKAGKQGAEELSRFLDFVFGVPIGIVNKYGGFVSVFAGDAFCAVFPENKADNIISVVNSITAFFADKAIYQTPWGEFNLKARQTVCYGKVEWQIFSNRLQNEYVFSGDTMRELAELSSLKEDVVFSGSAARRVGEAHFTKLDTGYCLITQEITVCDNPLVFHYTPDTVSRFINPKFTAESPQNEIRSAAYCFANLESIKAEDREKAVETIQSLADVYGGFVNKYDATDKGLIAVILFGLPKSEDKTLDRICRFALHSIESIPELALGIASGSVFAGYTGSGEIKEYTALGHPVNLASRLMSKASSGEILTDHYLYLKLYKSYEFDQIGSISLKGISFPIEHYRLSEKADHSAKDMGSLFVGRDAEIARIRQVIGDSITASQNSVVYVLGDAGIGKSRLIKEALASYPDTGFHKLFCHCDAILPKPNELIKQIIRAYFGFNYLQSAVDGIAAFRTKWAALAHGDSELMRIESLIAELLGYEWQGSIWSLLPPDEKPSQLQTAFLGWIKAITAEKPVLIHLDDAQWIDSQSLEYLQLLSDKDIAPVCIIAACRYLDNGEKPDLELRRHQRVELDLNTLSETGSRQLIQSLINLLPSADLSTDRPDNVPEPTFALIHSRAMGNPFFIEQLVSYLQENGKLDTLGEITGAVTDLSSFSISDIIGSRIDRLTENLRETVSNASVLGMEFNVKVLSNMLNNDLSEGLATGINNRIWQDLDDLRYIFSHILIKDVVYQRMMSQKLQILHQTAAKAMEIVYADDLDRQAEEIALHFEKADQAVTAAEYFDKAGCWFKENYDYANAKRNLNQALQIRESVLGTEHPDTAVSLYHLSSLYQGQGNYEQAEPYCLRALGIREKVMGAEHPDTATSLNDLAELYCAQGKYDPAESVGLRALEIRKKVLGTEHPDTANSLSTIALLHYLTGKYEPAKVMYQQALEIREKVLGAEHSETATLLHNLARMHYKQGKYQQVESMYLQALDIYEKDLGAEHPYVATSLDSLAGFYREQGKFDQAEPLFTRALAIRKKVLGAEHPIMAISLGNLGNLYSVQGKFDQAESMHSQSLEINEKVLGAEHPTTAAALNNLSISYTHQGKYDLAEPLYVRALTIREKVLGAEHPDTASSLDNLAIFYSFRGKYDQAEPLYLRALDIRRKALGAEHPIIADSLNNLAILYINQDKPQQAEPIYILALEIREKIYGAEHPTTATAVNNLACLYEKQGKCEQAETLYTRAMHIWEKALGAEHPDSATAQNNLAGLYLDQGKYEQAEPLYVRALGIYEKALGAEHPNIAGALNNLASLFTAQGKYEQAKPLYLRALQIWEQVLGAKHPNVIKTLKKLIDLYEKTGDSDNTKVYQARFDSLQNKPD